MHAFWQLLYRGDSMRCWNHGHGTYGGVSPDLTAGYDCIVQSTFVLHNTQEKKLALFFPTNRREKKKDNLKATY
jgi:hypothetical protein